MFKPGNISAENIEIHMTRIEFKRWRQLHGWSRSQTARQLGLDRKTVCQYEIKGGIPDYIETICKHA